LSTLRAPQSPRRQSNDRKHSRSPAETTVPGVQTTKTRADKKRKKKAVDSSDDEDDEDDEDVDEEDTSDDEHEEHTKSKKATWEPAVFMSGTIALEEWETNRKEGRAPE